MNLFVLGLNLTSEHYNKIKLIKASILDLYPELKFHEEFSYSSSSGKDYLTTISTIKEISSPRVYVATDNENIVFYSGLVVGEDNFGSYYDANNILKNYESIKYNFEGQASVLKINKITNDVDIITDNLGIEQVFYSYINNELIISNSLRIIEIICNNTTLDLISASLFASIGWVASDNTLNSNIKVIPGGQHWRWNTESVKLSKSTYYDPTIMMPQSKDALNKKNIYNLETKISKYLIQLGEKFNLECPLTGGFDSRLVAAFLINKNIDANYYTNGTRENGDVQIASLLADKFNLPYDVYEMNDLDVDNNWNLLIKNFIQRTNGIVSLWQINAYYSHLMQQRTNKVENIKVKLTTMGAESARLTYSKSFIWNTDFSSEDLLMYLKNNIVKNNNNILTNEALETSQNYLSLFFQNHIQKGLNYRLIPEAFHLVERVGRFRANGRVLYSDNSDSFSIFLTKAFLKTSAKLHPIDKIASPLHYKLMKQLNYDLFNMPFYNKDWPIQNKLLRILKGKINYSYRSKINEIKSRLSPQNKQIKIDKNVKTFNYKNLFDLKLSEFKNICLDQNNSELWKIVNRKNLESILSGKTIYNHNALNQLYAIITLFYKEYFKNGNKSIR